MRFDATKFVFHNPSTQAECDTRSVFKQSLIGLNSEFTFPLDWSQYQSWRAKSALVFTRCCRANNWIHFSPNGNDAR